MWMWLALAEIPFALLGVLILGYAALIFLDDAFYRFKQRWTVQWQMDYNPNRVKKRGKDVRPWHNML